MSIFGGFNIKGMFRLELVLNGIVTAGFGAFGVSVAGTALDCLFWSTMVIFDRSDTNCSIEVLSWFDGCFPEFLEVSGGLESVRGFAVEILSDSFRVASLKATDRLFLGWGLAERELILLKSRDFPIRFFGLDFGAVIVIIFGDLAFTIGFSGRRVKFCGAAGVDLEDDLLDL